MARSAALVAPALPIASVPTGMPPGICTIESSESMPFRAWLSTGTPSTGSRVCAATMPGKMRRAAGAGDDHFDPAGLRRMRRYSAISGVRCAETIAHLVRHAERVEHLDRRAASFPNRTCCP